MHQFGSNRCIVVCFVLNFCGILASLTLITFHADSLTVADTASTAPHTTMQAIHNAIEKTLRAERLEEWQCGAELIHELLARGANPSKLDGTGRTALAVMKEFPLLPDDTRNGKEDIVSYQLDFRQETIIHRFFHQEKTIISYICHISCL